MIRIFLLFQLLLSAADFDCILIGSSPATLFEALYQAHSGNKVLVLEASDRLGGAWKSIDICGITNADGGCHEIGNNPLIKEYLETYIGCKTVPMGHGFYFAGGCHELIEHMEHLLALANVDIRLETKAGDIFVHQAENIVSIQTNKGAFSTKKLIVTPMSQITFPQIKKPQNCNETNHYHVYLLVHDPTPPRFAYRNGGTLDASRIMNLTSFNGLAESPLQLIAIQTHSVPKEAELYFNALKTQNLLGPDAYLVRTDSYIYKAGRFHQGNIKELHAEGLIEVLQTGSFQGLSRYVAKWQSVLKPWNQQ